MLEPIHTPLSAPAPSTRPEIIDEDTLNRLLLTTAIEEAHFTQHCLSDVVAARQAFIGRPLESVRSAIEAHVWKIRMCTFREAERFTFIPREFFPLMIRAGDIRSVEKDGQTWLYRADWMADFRDHLEGLTAPAAV